MNYVFGVLGIVVLLGIAYLLSEKKRNMNWRTVIGALLIQFAFGFIVLRWSAGRRALNVVTNAVDSVIGFANDGIDFVFGPAIPEGGFVSEAPLVVRPYVNTMSRSEIFSIMTGGMASVSGSVLAGYALMGVPLEYLIAASFMAAPAGLLVSKLIIPETEKKAQQDIETVKLNKSANVIDAAASGAVDGLQIALAVGATLIAFIGLIALINGILSGVGGWFGYPGLSLQSILGVIFSPIAYIIGVPMSKASIAGSLIGQKFIVNEFVAFSALAEVIDTISPRTLMITSFALCGFANLSSIAIQISGLSSIAPVRRKLVTQLGLRAVLAATIANLLNASIAECVMFNEDGVPNEADMPIPSCKASTHVSIRSEIAVKSSITPCVAYEKEANQIYLVNLTIRKLSHR